MEKVVETIFLGRNIIVYNENNSGTIPSYTITDDSVTVQYELTAEEVMAWMANTMMNASSKK